MLTAGADAPAFELAATTGKVLSLSDGLAEGRLLLAFFKVGCPTCQFTFPFLQRLHQQVDGQGAQIWGVVQDKAEDGARFASTYGITFPILVDAPPYKVSRAYGLSHVPSLFLIKQDRHIEFSGDGFSKADLLAIQHSLSQTAPGNPAALFLPSEKIPEYKPG